MDIRDSAAGTVTIVTGPPGVDVGPVAARLGRGLGDGLAIRTVVSNGPDHPHVSPNPHHANDAGGHPGSPEVTLWVLPSAWQDSDTNLGIAYTGLPDFGLRVDLRQLDPLGLNPAHRVTVQHRGSHQLTAAIPDPVGVGDLAEAARDSVLRMGGRVLIEAGDGQTAQDALHTVGLAPWAPCIGRLDIWVVLDAMQGVPDLGGVTAARARLIVDAAELVRANGGPSRDHDDIGAVNIWLALLNTQALPGLEALAGLDETVQEEPLPDVDQVTRHAVGVLLDDFLDRTGSFPALLGTGRSTFLDLVGNHGDIPAP